MVNRGYIVTILVLTFIGCSSSEIQENIDSVLGKDKDQSTVIIDKGSDENLALKRHNEARDELFDSPLKWSDEVAKDAQSYADTLAKSGDFKHDPKNRDGYRNGPYGENLYATSDDNIKMVDAVDNWYVEKDFYDYDTNSCEASKDNIITVGITAYNTCGHYTQIIWRDTEYVGCAKATYETGDLEGGTVVVCKYKKPGNVAIRDTLLKPY